MYRGAVAICRLAPILASRASSFEFECDRGNRTKSATKHGISIEEVEAVFRSGRVQVISARPAHKKERKQYEETLRKISEKL